MNSAVLLTCALYCCGVRAVVALPLERIRQGRQEAPPRRAWLGRSRRWLVGATDRQDGRSLRPLQQHVHLGDFPAAGVQ